MLEEVKLALRVSNDAYDSEIINLIESAKMDLQISGIIRIDETDPLIRRAVFLFAKSSFGIDNPNAEKFYDSYVMLKQHLSLSGDYNGSPVE